jgi:putative transposase
LGKGTGYNKTANVLDVLPESVHGRAKTAIHEITEAENKKVAERAIEALAGEFGIKWPKAVAKIVDEKEELLTFYEFLAEHWVHLRTTNPIESTFAPVRARTDVTKEPGSREARVAMIFKLLEAAEGRWRRINGAHLVPLVQPGAEFANGELVERSEEKDAA